MSLEPHSVLERRVCRAVGIMKEEQDMDRTATCAEWGHWQNLE